MPDSGGSAVERVHDAGYHPGRVLEASVQLAELFCALSYRHKYTRNAGYIVRTTRAGATRSNGQDPGGSLRSILLGSCVRTVMHGAPSLTESPSNPNSCSL